MNKTATAALACVLALPTAFAASPAPAQPAATAPAQPAAITSAQPAATTPAQPAASVAAPPDASIAGTAPVRPVGPAGTAGPGGPGGTAGTGAGMRGSRLPPGTYIAGPTLPDTVAVLPAPPVPGSPEQADDDATFAGTRALQGTARWALATRDADLSAAAILADFDCALGVRLDQQRAPALSRLLTHAGADMSPEIDRTKQHWERKRPFIGNAQPICVPRSAGLSASPSYPSGHTTLLFGTAMILAELAPDRAGPILQRGRTLSESRIVCGVHWLSDVQAGFVEAGTLVAALNGSPAFRADLERARSELAALRQAGGGGAPDANECRIEADAAADSPLFRLPSGSR